MGDDQRYFEHRKSRNVKRVGMHNALHVGAGSIDPRVKAVGGVGHTATGQNVEVLVDHKQVGVGDLVEPHAELLGVKSAGLLSPCGDLSGQSRVMSGVEQCAAGQRQFLAQCPPIVAEVLLHRVERAAFEVFFGVIECCTHSRTPPSR